MIFHTLNEKNHWNWSRYILILLFKKHEKLKKSSKKTYFSEILCGEGRPFFHLSTPLTQLAEEVDGKKL